MDNHSLQNTREEPVAAKRPQPHPPHTRGTRYLSSPAAATLHGKTQGFVLRLSPQIKPRATFMQPLQCVVQHRGQHASLYAHGNRTRQQSCSHHIAICNQRIKKRIELRRHEQPLVAEHTGGTNCGRNGPSRTRRTHEVQVPFIAGCSHFTQRNARFRRAPAFFSNQNPCNIHAAITVASMLSIFLRVTLQFVSSAVRHVLTMYGL